MLGGPIDASTRDAAASLVRDGQGIGLAVDRARAFADTGRSVLDALPASPGVTGLRAAADYLLISVEAAAT